MTKRLEKIFLFLLFVAINIFLVCPPADSVDFPKRTIKLIVSADPGGGEDTEARGIVPHLEKYLGVKILIENQGAAGGKIAFERFQKAEPNGYTLITYTYPKSVVIEYTDKVNFKSKDFTPVFAWSWSSQVLVVNAETWKTFDEFLKTAKTKTMVGGLSGGHSTLGGLVTADELGLKVNWVPYEGSAGSLAALAGKHIEFSVTVTTSAVPLMEAGKLRSLIVFDNDRDPYLPSVPCSKELGVRTSPIPGIRGIEAPPNTSPAIVKILEEACTKAAKEPGFIEFAKKRKMVIHPLNSKEYGKAINEMYPIVEKYQHILKK
jgi:tripartite-type tricarboxylate transporter receptor subunit TctC